MKPWRRILLIIVVLMLVIPAVTLADQGEDEYEWKTWRTRRSHAGFNGYGGFAFTVLPYSAPALDNLAIAMGLEPLDDAMLGIGGGGMAHLGGGWRIGGMGYSATAKTTGVYTEPSSGETYNRKMTVDFAAGGFAIEYSPWMIGPINFGLGATLGWGGVIIRLQQDKGAFTWDDLTSQYIGVPGTAENITSEITQGFVFGEPYATARVHLLDWMAVSATVGYHFDSLQTSGWMFAEKDLSGQGPGMNMNNGFIQIGMVFGG